MSIGDSNSNSQDKQLNKITENMMSIRVYIESRYEYRIQLITLLKRRCLWNTAIDSQEPEWSEIDISLKIMVFFKTLKNVIFCITRIVIKMPTIGLSYTGPNHQSGWWNGPTGHSTDLGKWSRFWLLGEYLGYSLFRSLILTWCKRNVVCE